MAEYLIATGRKEVAELAGKKRNILLLILKFQLNQLIL